MKRRYTVNPDGLLVDRDGVILGRITAITLEVENPQTADGSLGLRGSCSFGGEETSGQQQTLLRDGGLEETPNEPDDVADVWQHYVSTMQPRNTTLNPQERKLIRDALKVATTDELKLAITGNRQSRFHQGDNDRGRKYNRLSQIIKGRVGKETTRERVDYFIDIAVKAGFSLTGVAGSSSEGWVDVDSLPVVHRAKVQDLRRRAVLAHRSGDDAAERVARDELRGEGFEIVFDGERYVGLKRADA